MRSEIPPILKFKDNANMTIINPHRFGGLDPDAQIYITAASITDPTQISAIDVMFKALKTQNLWGKLYLLYPFIGGNAAAHAVNAKNPGTNDLTFLGTLTHDTDGVLPNGTSGRATNGWIMSSEVAEADGFGYFYYAKGNLPTSTASTLFQAWNSGLNEVWGYIHSATAVAMHAGSQSSAAGITSTTPGMYMGAGKNTAFYRAWKNDTIFVESGAVAPPQDLDRGFYLFCRQYALAAARFSAVQCAGIGFTYYLTEAEGNSLYNIIQTCQTTLGRQV